MFCENQAAIHIAENLVFHEWIDCQFFRECTRKDYKHPIYSQQRQSGMTQFYHILYKLGTVGAPTWGGGLKISFIDYKTLLFSCMNQLSIIGFHL